MPKLKSPLFSFEASGSLGPELAYQHAPSGPRAISRVARRDPQTPAQLASRALFTNCVDFWHLLTDTEKAALAAEARGTPLNGYNLFMKTCLKGELVVDPIAAHVYNSTAITVPHGISTLLGFDTQLFDTDDLFDPLVNNTRFICRTPGLYILSFSCLWATNAVGYRNLYIWAAGAWRVRARSNPTLNGMTGLTVTTPPFPMAIDDFAYVHAGQGSGGPLDILSGNRYTPDFAIHRVR